MISYLLYDVHGDKLDITDKLFLSVFWISQIGNWSRWLTDLFGMDDDDPLEDRDENDLDSNDGSQNTLKSFHLLNALSDLLMLPKDMLLNASIRKEVSQ